MSLLQIDLFYATGILTKVDDDVNTASRMATLQQANSIVDVSIFSGMAKSKGISKPVDFGIS